MPKHINSTSFKKGHIPWHKGTRGLIKSPRKGKTLEEIYGKEKAIQIREKCKLGRFQIQKQWESILETKKEFEEQGYIFIPFIKVIPDAIAIKDNKIFAIEVEHKVPNYDKYTTEILPFYDDVIWIIKKKGE